MNPFENFFWETVFSDSLIFWVWINQIQPFKFFISLFLKFYTLFFVLPLFYLWAYGPSFGKYGGIGGQPHEFVCSHLAGMSPEFWKKNEKECSLLVLNHFLQFLTFGNVFLYVFLAKCCFNFLVRRRQQ